ncbi:MAG TPA: NUDIX domain-containing protein [Vicinamibacterales bacterium]|jgi:8-oxo-dGTP pyrophosphatase MutT (NUDIX family)
MIVHRNAVRAILLTPASHVLLLRIRPPQGGDPFWILPGGGIRPGETLEEALRRELWEEVGLDDCSIGPLVWKRQHTFNWGDRRICQREEYFVVHVNDFEPRMSDAIEMEVLETFRWWPTTELSQTLEQLTPLSLPTIVGQYLANGPPTEPLVVEVLVD